MMSGSPKNAGKYVKSNIACAQNQPYKRFSFLIGPNEETLMPVFVEPNIISDVQQTMSVVGRYTL